MDEEVSYSSRSRYHSVELVESPKPGVSTIVKRNLTPRSSISTVDASMFNVLFLFYSRVVGVDAFFFFVLPEHFLPHSTILIQCFYHRDESEMFLLD